MLENSRIPYSRCPLCDSTDQTDFRKADCTRHPLYHPDLPPTVTWRKCGACGHVFTEGYFSDAALAILFAKTNEKQKVGFDIEKQRYVSARMVDSLLPFAAGGHWLDIGFGNGSLLFTAQEYGFHAVGIDLRKDNVRDLAKLGIEAHCVDIEHFQHPEKFAVISMADVLEHMAFPIVGLRSVHRLLRSDGVVFLSMPNLGSVLWNVLDQNRQNPYWQEIEHYHNFSRERLYRLLVECGFEPLRFGISQRYRACMEVVARRVQ